MRYLLFFFFILALTACDDDKKAVPPPPPTSGRGDAVLSTKASTPTTTAKSVTATQVRQLCTMAPQATIPKSAPEVVASGNGLVLPSTIGFGTGRWIWLNFWAAWCGPCKEEMPRLTAWQKKLQSSGTLLDLVFISMDDDKRQLERFLNSSKDLQSTYWLPEGAIRSAWMSSLGLKDPPNLPVQVLVNPGGVVACVIQGAVEDRDFQPIASFLQNQR